jgi:phage terminase small subunit
MKSLRCKATGKASGKQCKRQAIMGSTVCRVHGGAAPQVKAAADRRIREYVQKMVDPDRVLAEIARVAMSDATAVFDSTGKIKPMSEWTEEAKAAVSAVELVKRNLTAGDGETDEILKLRFWDKSKNLEMLAKHLGLLSEKLEHTGGISIKWED